MAAEIHTWYSPDEPFLKIGEPVKESLDDDTVHTVKPAAIVFQRGFAEVEMTPENIRHLTLAARTYPLTDLGPDTDIGVPGDPGTVVCQECGYVSKSAFGLKAHLRAKHKPT